MQIALTVKFFSVPKGAINIYTVQEKLSNVCQHILSSYQLININ